MPTLALPSDMLLTTLNLILRHQHRTTSPRFSRKSWAIIKIMENLFKNYKIKVQKGGVPRTQREELIEKFRTKLNEARVGTKFKPLSHVAVKNKLCHITKEHELYAFYKDCEGAKSFTRYFWWSLKPHEEIDPQ